METNPDGARSIKRNGLEVGVMTLDVVERQVEQRTESVRVLL